MPGTEMTALEYYRAHVMGEHSGLSKQEEYLEQGDVDAFVSRACVDQLDEDLVEYSGKCGEFDDSCANCWAQVVTVKAKDWHSASGGMLNGHQWGYSEEGSGIDCTECKYFDKDSDEPPCDQCTSVSNSKYMSFFVSKDYESELTELLDKITNVSLEIAQATGKLLDMVKEVKKHGGES